MTLDGLHKPQLRPVEAFALPGERGQIGVRDRSGLSEIVLTLSPAALHLIALMDGNNTIDQIRSLFQQQFGQPIATNTLERIHEHLEQALLLEGPAFEAHYGERLRNFRVEGIRRMVHANDLGVTAHGAIFRDMLAPHCLNGKLPAAHIRGLIAPHLDYPRGAPCYGPAYAALRHRTPPQRVIILGTNHNGRSTGVVATGCDFETPLGLSRCDQKFLHALESRCGDLRTHELDHVNEHSVELQVAWLQHLYGAENFTMVAFLCPDPCGATRTGLGEPSSVGLRNFAETLRELIANDPTETLVVAGADFSHIGSSFGDERPIDEAFLEEARQTDRRALDCLELGDPAGFVRCVAQGDNPTRICSAGCMFALLTALPGTRGQVVRYHQAVDRESQTCVSCAAVVFT